MRRCCSRTSPARSTPTKRSRRCSTPPATCAPSSSHRLKLYSVPQLHFAYDDSIESRAAHVEADRRRGCRRPQALAPEMAPADRRAWRARRSLDGVLLLDKPSGLSLQRSAAARQAALPRREGAAIPERSIRWRAGCCRSASARRPNSRTCCSKATRRYAATVRLGVTTTTGDAEGDRRRAPGRRVARRHRSRAAALRRLRSRRCRRAMRRSSTAGATTTSTRAKASTFLASPARSSFTSLRCDWMAAAGRRARACVAAKAPTSACWPRTSVRRWAAARISRRCAVWPAAVSTICDGACAGSAGGAGRYRSAMPVLLPVDALLSAPAATATSTTADAWRFRAGQRIAAATCPTATTARLCRRRLRRRRSAAARASCGRAGCSTGDAGG